jgi:hypothetical protein
MPNPTCPRCGTDVDQHEANRCLDAWVATVILGWKNCDPDEVYVECEIGEDAVAIGTGVGTSPEKHFPKFLARKLLPAVSSSWEGMGLVVEACITKGWDYEIKGTSDDRPAKWKCQAIVSTDNGSFEASGPTSMLAVARAALKAMGGATP